MWPFIFILAMVPMIYYWSDSVATVFPALAKYLPEKQDGAKGAAAKPGAGGANSAFGTPNKWAQASPNEGYVAWLVSRDGQYRVAVGCQKAEPAGLQVTHISGKAVAPQLVLDFQFGQVPFAQGLYSGPDLLNAVSQFEAMALQVPPSETQLAAKLPGATVAQFTVERRESGLVARNLQQICRF